MPPFPAARADSYRGRSVAVGPPTRLKYAVIGDPVNVAARIESIGEPNALTLGEATHRRLANASGCEDLGETKLRGREHPIRVYRIRPQH